jgi:hypothetical protein
VIRFATLLASLGELPAAVLCAVIG